MSLVDDKSESVAETLSRLTFLDFGLPTPETQVEIFNEHGAEIARVDFLWPEYGVIGECDGFGKYFDGLSPAETREKLAKERIATPNSSHSAIASFIGAGETSCNLLGLRHGSDGCSSPEPGDRIVGSHDPPTWSAPRRCPTYRITLHLAGPIGAAQSDRWRGFGRRGIGRCRGSRPRSPATG